jgi:hypothetical protein
MTNLEQLKELVDNLGLEKADKKTILYTCLELILLELAGLNSKMGEVFETVLNVFTLGKHDFKGLRTEVLKAFTKKVSSSVNGKKIILQPWEVLYNENEAEPGHKDRKAYRVFIVTATEDIPNSKLIGRSQKSEANFVTFTYGRGDVAGEEQVYELLGVKKGNGYKCHYRETVMAGENGAAVIAMTAEDFVEFLKIHPDMFIKQLKMWMNRAITSEEKLGEVMSLVENLNIEFPNLLETEKVIKQMIEIGESAMIARVLLAQKKQLLEMNSFFLEIEEDRRKREKDVFGLQERMRGMEGAFKEIMSSMPQNFKAIVMGDAQEITEQDVETLLQAVSEK